MSDEDVDSQHVIVQTLLGPTVSLYLLFCEDCLLEVVLVPVGSVSGCSGRGSRKSLGMRPGLEGGASVKVSSPSPDCPGLEEMSRCEVLAQNCSVPRGDGPSA